MIKYLILSIKTYVSSRETYILKGTQKKHLIEMVLLSTHNKKYNLVATYDNVSTMLDNLGWGSLENRRIDSRLFMFHRIIYGYVAIQIPTYFEKPQFTCHMHPLSYRQIHTHAVYYQQSFYPATIVLWNKLPSEIVLMDDLDSLKEGVSKINHQSP